MYLEMRFVTGSSIFENAICVTGSNVFVNAVCVTAFSVFGMFASQLQVYLEKINCVIASSAFEDAANIIPSNVILGYSLRHSS